MKINFYFNGEAVSELPYQVIKAYVNQFLQEMNHDMHQQIVRNNDELDIYVVDIKTNSMDDVRFKPNQFEILYTCKPFIFTTSDHSNSYWLSMRGRINAEQQIELTYIATQEDKVVKEFFTVLTQSIQKPYIVDVIHCNSPANAQINKLNSEESSHLSKLPVELIPWIARSLPGHYAIASIFTPDMQMFAQIIHTETQRLFIMDDEFARDKAEALTEAKERVLKAAVSATFFSLNQFYAYKEGNAASVNEVASRKPHPKWDQPANDLFLGHGLWNSSNGTSLFGSGDLTLTEKNLGYAAREPKLMLDGDWQDELLSASHNLRNTRRLQF